MADPDSCRIGVSQDAPNTARFFSTNGATYPSPHRGCGRAPIWICRRPKAGPIALQGGTSSQRSDNRLVGPCARPYGSFTPVASDPTLGVEWYRTGHPPSGMEDRPGSCGSLSPCSPLDATLSPATTVGPALPNDTPQERDLRLVSRPKSTGILRQQTCVSGAAMSVRRLLSSA